VLSKFLVSYEYTRTCIRWCKHTSMIIAGTPPPSSPCSLPYAQPHSIPKVCPHRLNGLTYHFSGSGIPFAISLCNARRRFIACSRPRTVSSGSRIGYLIFAYDWSAWPKYWINTYLIGMKAVLLAQDIVLSFTPEFSGTRGAVWVGHTLSMSCRVDHHDPFPGLAILIEGYPKLPQHVSEIPGKLSYLQYEL
jgi:hypothetical protein